MTVTVKGTELSTTTSVSIPAHVVGDLIIIIAEGTSAVSTDPAPPAASGTIPAWVKIDGGGVYYATAYRNIATFYYVATATDHTSGSWSDTNLMAAIVISGQSTEGASPIGGSDVALSTAAGYITAPAVTLDGEGSLIIRYARRSYYNFTWGDAPAGYTVIAETTDLNTPRRIAVSDSVDSAPDLNMSPSLGAGFVWLAATIEILAAPSANFFAFF